MEFWNRAPLETYASLLFNREEWVNWVVDRYSETLTYPRLGAPEGARWACVNPLQEDSTRAQGNVIAYRNFVLEIDNMDYEEQLTYVNRQGVPVTTAVFSGNKSIHFVLALDEDVGKEDYARYCKLIAKALPSLDSSCLEPSRLTRCPAEGQPMLYHRGRVPRLELDCWLEAKGLSLAGEQRPQPLEYTPLKAGRLTMKTINFIGGRLNTEEMHQASLHATKNMLESGFSEADVLAVLVDVRKRSPGVNESTEASESKAEKIIEWVLKNWRE